MDKDLRCKLCLISAIAVVVIIVVIVVILLTTKTESFESSELTEKGKNIASEYINVDNLNNYFTDCQQKRFLESIAESKILTTEEERYNEVKKIFNEVSSMKCFNLTRKAEQGRAYAEKLTDINKFEKELTEYQINKLYEMVADHPRFKNKNPFIKKQKLNLLNTFYDEARLARPPRPDTVIEGKTYFVEVEPPKQVNYRPTPGQIYSNSTPEQAAQIIHLEPLNSTQESRPSKLTQRVLPVVDLSGQSESVASQVSQLTQEQKKENAEAFARQFNSYAVDDFEDYNLN